jgi:hypothetical protein
LINGTTITLYAAEEFDELEFFHIKLETHDVIYAEGAACETLSTVSESASNFAEYYRAYGAPKMGEDSCAPLLFYGCRRGQIKSRLRSAISPWVRLSRKDRRHSRPLGRARNCSLRADGAAVLIFQEVTGKRGGWPRLRSSP